MISFLKNLFEPEKDIEINYKEAEQFYRDQESDQIEKTVEKAELLTEKTSEIVSDIESEIEALQGYKDRQNIQAVEDVAENFFKSRKKILDSFQPSGKIREHRDDLEQFLSEFEDTSRKQAAVMKRAQDEFNPFFKTVEDLNTHLQEVEDFLEEEYNTVDRLNHLNKLSTEIEDCEKQIDKLRKDIKETKPSKIEEDIKNQEEKLNRLKNSSDWTEKERLEDEKNNVVKEKKSLRNQLSRNISKIDRGIKKIIYTVENQGKEFEQDLEELKDLRQKNFDSVSSPKSVLREAVDVIEDENLLDETQKEKFIDSVEKFETFESDLEKIEEYERKEKELEEKLENLRIEEKVHDANKEIKKLKRKHIEAVEEVEEKEKEIEKQKKQKTDILDQLENSLNKSFKHAISLEQT